MPILDTAKTDTGEAGRILDLVDRSLDDDQAEDVVRVDLHEKTSIGDYMIIASGRSRRHVSSIADHLIRRLKQAGIKGIVAEGQSQGDWVLIDAGDVIVHVFRPEVRSFYNLEKMWGMEQPTPEHVHRIAIGA